MVKKLSVGRGATHKRAYVQPRLIRYGALRTLTQNGSGTNSEGGSPGNCKGPTSKKVCTSDRAAKQNIVRIGTHPLGIGLYLFDYRPEFRDEWGHARQFGVMADEVMAVMPKAVRQHQDGYKMVDYALLGIARSVE